jgi:phage protein D
MSAGAPAFALTAGGQPLPAAMAVRTLTVSRTAGERASAVVVIDTGPAQAMLAADASLAIGAVMAIALGHGGATSPVFEGRVVAHRWVVDPRQPLSWAVECRADRADRRTRLPGAPVLTLTHGADLLACDLRADADGVRGTVQTQGTLGASIGGPVELSGLGPGVDGVLTVQALVHRIDPTEGWTSTLTLRP